MKVGIFGWGVMGRKRAKALAELGDEYIGHYDPGERKQDKDWRVPRWLLDNAEAFVVSTTHDALSEVALQCISTGKPTFIEKPVGMNSRRVAGLLNEARTRNVPVGVGYSLRHHGSVQSARIAMRDLGAPWYMRGVYGHPGRPGYEKEWRCHPERGGGELLDQGTHLIDLASHLLGEKLHEAVVDGSETECMWRTHDVANIRLRWSGNVRADLQASWVEATPIFRVEVVCERGAVHLQGLGGSYGQEHLVITPRDRNSLSTFLRFDDSDWLRREWESFHNLVQAHNAGHTRQDALEQALAVLEVVETVRAQ